MEHHYAAGRRGIDVLGERLPFDTTLMEQGYHVDKLGKANVPGGPASRQ